MSYFAVIKKGFGSWNFKMYQSMHVWGGLLEVSTEWCGQDWRRLSCDSWSSEVGNLFEEAEMTHGMKWDNSMLSCVTLTWREEKGQGCLGKKKRSFGHCWGREKDWTYWLSWGKWEDIPAAIRVETYHRPEEGIMPRQDHEKIDLTEPENQRAATTERP